ncbi:MAG: molybdopterin-dependent oxidoreductase [Gemmataceae bacterium]
MQPLLVRGACPHDCPDTCGVITEVAGGKAVGFRGNPDHPITQGWLCAKVRPYLDHVYHPDRLTHPLRRVGPKGAGQWERVSWDSALREIGDRWKGTIAEYGAEAILPYSYSGTLGLVQLTVANGRFWNRLGASQLQRTICCAAAQYAITATVGAIWSAPYEDVLHSRLVLLWGHNPISTAPHFMPFLRQAQRNGCKVVVIDPRRTATAKTADMHVAARPGSDGVLAMGLARLLVERNLHDESWLQAHTFGWFEFRERLARFPLDRVAAETGVSGEQISELASLYGTLKPGLLKTTDGVNRNYNGGQNVRAMCALPAITGQYGTRGGGLSYSTSGYVKWDAEAIHKRSHCPRPGRAVNMNRLGAALLGEVQAPPIKSLFVFGANPVTSSPNAGKIIEGMRREDLFTVVHDLFLTDTADYADLVLPATSQLEQTDLNKAYGHTLLTYNAQAIPPLGESKSNWEVMGLLARAMGFEEPWLHQSADEVIDEVLTATAATEPHFRGITLERLRREGHVPLNIPSKVPFEDGVFPTRSGKVQLAAPALAGVGYDPLPGEFRRDLDDGETGWPAAEALTLVSGASYHFVSSSFANQRGLLDRAGPPVVEVHPDDARARGIADGEDVILANGRGELTLRAVVTDAVRPGVVASPKGRWGRLSGGRNVNWLTTDALADFAGQSCFHSTRVWLRRA